jgi:uncharacterized membrane protein
MVPNGWRRLLRRRTYRPFRRRLSRRLRLFLEPLEDRIMPATLVVNNPTDAHVGNELSLREAIAQANTDATAGTSDTIVFESSLGSHTIALQSQLELSGAGAGVITVDGSSPSTPITLSADYSSGVLFRILLVDSGVQAVLTHLNFDQGQVTDDGGAIFNAGTLTVENANLSNNQATNGGAIKNQGTLALSNTTFSNNSASNSGGAIDNTGTATVIDCTFGGQLPNNQTIGNTAAFGGAISNEGMLTVSNTTFTGNIATPGSGGAIDSNNSATLTVSGGFFTQNSANYGGAIENYSATATLTNATLSDNSANTSGGAIDNFAGPLTLDNSTVSGNTASSNGGGINNNTGGTLTLTNTTVSGNTAFSAGGGIENDAGTLTLFSATVSGNFPEGINNNGGTLALENTIVAGNGYSPRDIAGSITTDDGNNLLGTAVNNSTTDPHPGPADVFTDSPGLATLGNYGGPTETMALQSGSLAIGAGNAGAANLPGTDERGLPRTVNGSLDIGAFQTQPPAVVFTSLGQTADAGQPMGPITVQLQDLDGNPAPVGNVSYSANGTTADASGTSNLTLVNGAGFAAGQTGQALNLNGVNQYALTPNLKSLFANNDANATVSLSFNAAGPGVVMSELGQTTLNTGWHDSQIEILANGSVEVRVWNLPAVSLGTASFNAWHNVVLRYNAATQKLDGFLDSVASATSVSGARQTPYGAGFGLYYAFGATDTQNLGSGAYFNGLIQNINIFNRALSNAEVQTLYAGGSGVTVVTLGSSSAGGSFSYPGGQPIAGGQIIVPPGASSVTLDYTDTQPGTPTLTATAPGFATTTQQETILPAPISNTPSTDIVVGRTLSAYFTGDVQNNQETITFTVYNQQASSITGVLLTDTLAPGVTLVSASVLPDQNGQQLAWSLGTIQGYDRASVTLTVALGAGLSTPPQLDMGAQAFATLNAGPISNSTPAAILTQGSVDPNLLASTPDANTTDPYIQQEAAALDYNAQNIFNFLHNNVGYNSYLGSLRGARGTLWSSAGNALDVASLGVALMRASGIPAQYVQGTLSYAQAQTLILSMFPASYQTVGYIPAGTITSDPANDSQLLSETESHYWFEFTSGTGWVNADPLMPGAQVGQTFTAATGSFTEVAQNLRQTTEVSLKAEIYSQAAAAFGLGDGISDVKDAQGNPFVLDQTFNDVDLVGRPLTISNLVNTSSLGALFISSTTNTYTPYIELGDEAFPDPSQDATITGTQYQEVLTTFPLGEQILTGLVLNITLSGPQGPSETYTRALVDRIGYAARQGLAQSNLSIDPKQPPIINDNDVFTVNILPGLQSLAPIETTTQAALQHYANASQVRSSSDPADTATALRVLRDFVVLTAEDQTMQFLADSSLGASSYSLASSVVAYYDRPSITIFSEQNDPTARAIDFSIDLRRETERVIALPGQELQAAQIFNFSMGLFDNALEAQIIPAVAGSENIGTTNIFLQAGSQGIPLVLLSSQNISVLSTLNISANAKAYITAAVGQGLLVIVPSRDVTIGITSAISWLQFNPNTGETVGVLENGIHSDTLEKMGADLLAFELDESSDVAFSESLGEFERLYLRYAAELQKLENAAEAAEAAATAATSASEASDIAGIIDATNLPFGFAAEALAKSLGLPVEGLGTAVDGAVKLTPVILQMISYYLSRISSPPPDPPVPTYLTNVQLPALPFQDASGLVQVPAAAASGIINGNMDTANAALSGQVTTTWASGPSSAFMAGSLTVAQATVSRGGVQIGSGRLSLSSANEVAVAISGSNSYSVEGTGTLSFYGPAEASLGVNSNWSSYTATVNGNLSIAITTYGLTLNGKALPAGTYTITTSSATLSGSGPSTSPNVSGSASITTANATINLGPGRGNITVGGTSVDVTNGSTLDGYTGSITVAAGGGNNTGSVTLSGSTVDVLSVSATPNTLTTDQNTPVTFCANLNTSLADSYTITAQAPAGWTVTIDNSGNVTATPAPGLQGGTYPIQVIVQSSTDPNLVAQTTVEVAITPTQSGMTFAVNPDPTFTVPYNGAQVHTAFRAVIHNTGPATDTYNLNFANVPSGFTLVSSATSVMVSAGQTGIVGIYLIPNAGSVLPAPGTPLSFEVAATSIDDPETVTESFTMPAIDAVTIASNPVQVSTVPGLPATATVTLQNVGNVAASAALNFTTDTGLTLTGLSATPIMLAIGQTATETVQLTPASNVPLNSTLAATVNVGPAATQDVVSVLSVSPSPADPTTGQKVDVSADIFAGVLNPRAAEASYTVVNSLGNTVFTSTPAPINLGALPTATTVDLGTFSTAGLAAGQYTINVAVDETGGQPIAGAAGSGTVVVNSPLGASLTLGPDTLNPAGTNSATDTLTLASQPLLGGVQTDGTASTVALAGTLAYVVGTKDINIVDVSNPASPQMVGTFGASDLDGGGIAQIAGNELIVATSNASNANSFNLLIYSLANPQSPVLVSTTTIPYHYPAALVVQGNTVYIPTSGIVYDSGGNVDDQFGDFLAIDISNPAAPALAGALFTDKGTPNGGDSNQHDVVPINNSLAYVVGSTSTGPATLTGSGRVLVVNTADPANLTVAGTLNIPGTVDTQAIAVDGHYALVVGSTGGLLSPFSDPRQIGLTGNVTLTLLDISNPLQPTVVGSTLVTQNTFPDAGQSPSGQVQVVDLGNGRFAVSDTYLNGQPVILGVDASNPANLVTSTLSVPATANGLTAAGGNVYVTSTNGLQVYQAGALFNLAVNAQVVVPNGVTVTHNSFSTPPTQIVNGANSETLIWNLNLAPGASQQITWQSTVSNLQPGQVQQVVSGATFQYADLGTSEQITLPALAVGEVPDTQSVTIPVQVVVPGVPAIASAALAAAQIGKSDLANRLNDLSIALTNLVQTPTSAVYQSQAVAALTSIISQVTPDPFLVPFAGGLTAGSTAIAGATTAAAVDTAVINLGTALTSLAQAISDEAAHGFTLGLANSYGIIEPGVPTVFSVLIQNTGSATTTYDFSVSGLPAGVTATFNQPSIMLGAGQAEGSGNTITLSLSEPTTTTLIPANFTVTATAEGAAEITLGTPGQLTLRSESFQVAAVVTNPPFTQPGGQVDVIAKIESVVNEPRPVAVAYTVTDAGGNVVFTSAPVTTSFNPTSGLTTLDLGTFDTTGFANGQDTITVTVTDQSGQPLPSVTGQGSVLIGLPVSARLSVSPTTVPTGTGTVTNTLTIDPNAAGGGVLSLLGQVADNGTAEAVAVYGTLAYVPGTVGIDIVDVSDPTNPKLVSTFGQNDISQGGTDLAKVVGNLLIVASEQAGINVNHFSFLVYSLTNPLSPQLLGKTPFTIAYIHGMDVASNAAYFASRGGIFAFEGGLQSQFGNFSSIDFSTSTAPVLGSQLSSADIASPAISKTFEEDTALVNSQVAYVTSSTSTGGPPSGQTLTTGEGRLLVVNTQDPTKLQEYTLPDGLAGGGTELDVPGTTYLYGIAIEGHYALVAGNTEGIDQSGNAPGNLTLTVLDITDPLNPQIVTTVNTPNTFDNSVNNVKVIDLGNNQFAITGTLLNSNPVLEIVNISNPSNPTFGGVQVPATLNGGLTAANGKLYLTSASGLSIFNIGQLSFTPVTVSVEVPNGTGVSIVANSFNIQPTQIITGTTLDTLEWSMTLVATTTFSWQSTVSSLGAGEVRPVTLGATVDFTSQGTAGAETLAGTAVTGAPIIGLTPASETAQPGGSANYDVRLTNPTDTSVTYYVYAQQTTSGSVSGFNLNNNNPYITIGPDASVDVPLQVTSYSSATPGDNAFTVTATSATYGNGANGSAQGDFIVAGQPLVQADPNSYGVVATLTPAVASAGQGTFAQYVVQLTNTGSTDEQFVLAAQGLPTGVTADFGQLYDQQGEIDVPPGASNFRDVPVLVTVPAGAAPGAAPFTIIASAFDQTSSATANATLNVLANGVQVSINPGSGAPGTTFQMMVTNTGTVTDTYDLTLGGPAALVSSLGMSKVTLAPSASQMVPITTTAVSFADAGNLPLSAIATSETNAAVVADATADLSIPTSQGMTAQFNPDTVTLQQVGPASFLLLVDNTGNLQDSYTATITSSSGPVTASLMGLDGQPTQTVPIFILPGLSTGAILLQANMTGVGQGIVNVQVNSLTNGAITATTTATVNLNVVTPTTTTESSDHPNGSVFGEPITFTATVAATGTGTPTGTVDFTEGASDLTPGGVTLSGGLATFSTSSLAVGSHTITASYSGDRSFAPSSGTDSVAPQTVHKASSKTTLTSFPLAVFGEQVTFTATVSAVAPGAGTPTGTLTFKEGTRLLAANVSLNSMAMATFSTTPLSAGPHTITATYSGDGDFRANTGFFIQPVGKAGTQSSIVASVSTTQLGQAVTFTATVMVLAPGAGMPTGTFQFSDAKAPFGTATVDASGHATFSTSSLTGGSHAISATYLGDANFVASNQSLAIGQFVIRASDTTVMSVNPNPSVYGQSVTFTVAVQATRTGLPFVPSGVVHFTDTGAGAGNVILDATGRGTFSTSALTAGTHTLTAFFSGDRNFTASNSGMQPVVLTVQKSTPVVTLTSSRSTSVFGQQVGFTAIVMPAAPGGGFATGLVTFSDGNTTLGTAPLDVTARRTYFFFSMLGVGNHSITATYAGDSNFNSGTSSPAIALAVAKGSDTTIVTSSSTSLVLGQAVTFTALIRVTPPAAGWPTGMVTFMDGTKILSSGVSVVQGRATFSTSSLAVGNHVIIASYSGDNSFLPSNSSGYGETVKKSLTTAAAGIHTRSALSPSAVDALFASASDDMPLVAQPSARRNAHQRQLPTTLGKERSIQIRSKAVPSQAS